MKTDSSVQYQIQKHQFFQFYSILSNELDDVQQFFTHLEETGGAVTFGPSFEEKGQFWFGGFADPEGNPCWVVDRNCP